MITLVAASSSCGLILIHGDSLYKTAETFIKDFGAVNKGFYPDHTQFLFTHKIELSIGREIADYIEKHRLGTVTRSIGVNPAHGPNHYICVFVWSRDNARFAEHYASLVKPPELPDASTIAVKTKAA